jgi:hypothetical protein
MDKFEQISTTASYAVAIFGNPAREDFSLFDLTKGTPYPVDDIQREIAEGSLVFCGVIGIVHGLPRTALAEPLGEYTIAALTRAFIGRIEAAVTAVEGALTVASLAKFERVERDAESVLWLEALHALPDTRD